MSRPSIANAYHAQLFADNSHPLDQDFRRLIETDPNLRDLFAGLHEIQESRVKAAILRSATSGLGFIKSHRNDNSPQLQRLRPRQFDRSQGDLTKEEFVRLYEQIALVLGFSPEVSRVLSPTQVLRGQDPKGSVIKIASGSAPNAFAVTGTQKLLVSGYSGALLAQFSRGQIAAIIAHELGHIRSEHVLAGLIDEVLLATIFNRILKAINQSTEVASGSEDYNNIFGVLASATASERAAEGLTSNASQVINAWIKDAQEQILSLDEPAFFDLYQSYFLHLHKRVALFAPDDESTQTFRYLDALVTQGEELNENLDPKKFEDQLKQLFRKLRNAQSRSAEYTADNLSATAVPNQNLAATILQLMGHTRENANHPETRAALIDQYTNEWSALNELDLNGDQEPDNDFHRMNQHSTHPNNYERIFRAVRHPNILSLLYANPFMRLLLTERAMSDRATEEDSELLDQMREELVTQILATEGRIRPARSTLERIQAFISWNDPSISHNPRFENFVQFVTVYVDLLRDQAKAFDSLVDQNNYITERFPAELVTKVGRAYLDRYSQAAPDSHAQASLYEKVQLLIKLKAQMTEQQTAELRQQVNPQLGLEDEAKTRRTPRRSRWLRVSNRCEKLVSGPQ